MKVSIKNNTAPAGTQPWIALLALAAFAVALRCLAVPPALPDLDSVNFARSLSAFDLLQQSPHFPGYPLFVLFARAGAALGLPTLWALAFPSLVLAPVAVILLGRVLARQLGAGAGFAGAAVIACAPLAVLSGAAPTSDGAGFCALVIAAALALRITSEDQRRGVLLAGIVAGLCLGIRPSFLIAVAALVIALPARSRLRWAAGVTGGVLAWLVPLIAIVGPASFFTVAPGFVAGHFSGWGGTVAVRPDLWWRAGQFAFDVLGAGLGLPGPDHVDLASVAWATVLGVLAVAGWRFAPKTEAQASQRQRIARVALGVLAAHGAWMFLAQNLLKARHALPLLLGVALLCAVAVPAEPRRARVLASLVLAGLAWVCLPRALEQHRVPSPGAQLVAYAREHLPPGGTQLFTGEEARLFEQQAPWFRANRSPDDCLVHNADRLLTAGVRVYVTSAAPGVEQLEGRLTPVARFTISRRVRSNAYDLVLYRLAPPLQARAQVIR